MTEPAKVVALKPWLVTTIVHIHPGKDRIEHLLSDGCSCEPEVEFIAEDPKRVVITHHAIDGRSDP